MADADAMRAAIELYVMPSRLRQQRQAPLPDGIQELLMVAIADDAATRAAATYLERPPEILQRAARFFIEEVLLDPDSDSYRVFGAAPDAPQELLRKNMALLATWLHPDHGSTPFGDHLAGRINLAWDDLKTPERRAEYDHRLKAQRHCEQPASRTGSVRPNRAHVRRASVKARVVDWLRRLRFGTP